MDTRKGAIIEVSVNLEINASMWDCIKMRVLGITKDAIYEYLDHCKSKQYERNLLQNINDGILTTESIVNELAKREGVREVICEPYELYKLRFEFKGEKVPLVLEDTGPARILVVID